MTDFSSMVAHAFPYTRECVYLNTAATGLVSIQAGKAAEAFYRGALSRGFDARGEWQAMATEVAASVASIVGVPDAAVDFFSSTTHALNLVARSIRWSDGDEIVFAADEHASVREPWYEVQAGAMEVRAITVPNEESRQAALVDALSTRTRVLAVSHVHSQSGTRLDLQTLARACRANGTLLVVDGIQGVGAVPVDARGVDVYCAATFKWLLSGFGLAFLVTSENARSQMQPAFRGYRNPVPSQALQYSHLNYPALCVLRSNLEVFEAHQAHIFARISELTCAIRNVMYEYAEAVLTPEATELSAGIVSVKVADKGSASAIRDALAERRISVAARDNVIRISPHFYNSDFDVQALHTAWGDIRRY